MLALGSVEIAHSALIAAQGFATSRSQNVMILSARRLLSKMATIPLAGYAPSSVSASDEARTPQVQPAFRRAVRYCISADFA